MVSLRQLRFLVALSDTLNFSRAAEICNVTQPTLSTGLKELEERLGVQLAERTRHSVLMTPIGDQIAAQARDVLARVQDIEETARDEALAGTTLLRLGAIPTIGPFVMPRALPALRQAFPGMKLFLREELTEPLVTGLVEGRLDVILIALPHDLPDQIVTLPLFDDGYRLTTPRDHPLANLGSAGGADLDGRKLLLLERGHCLQRHALSSFPDVTLTEDESFSATSLPTLVSMVEEGLGLTLLPDLAVAAGAARGHEVTLTSLPEARPRHVVLAWRKSSSRSVLFARLGEIIRQARAALLDDANMETAAPVGESAAGKDTR